MKTLIKSLLVTFAVATISFTAVLAETNPGRRAASAPAFRSSFYTTADGKLSVALDKETGGPVEIRLLNSNGQVLFLQSVGKRKQTSRLRMDVSDLPDGTYQVAITNGVTTTRHALTLATQAPVATSRLVAVN